MKKLLNGFLSGNEKLIFGMNVMGTVWIFLLILLVVADVAGRIFFRSPLAGTAELCKTANPGIAFLQVTYVLWLGKHIRTTVILDRVSSMWRMLLDILAATTGIFMFAAIFYSNVSMTWIAWKLWEYEGEGALRVPTAPIRTIILVGSFCMIVQFLRNIHGYIASYRALQKREG
jgi:TRAP-type mannitol/chloroaromatic compound transport system permease small subunit